MADHLALRNGQPLDPPVIPLTDPIVTRGDGCFEAARSYGGVMFGLEDHLIRMEESAARLGMTLPARADLTAWAEAVARDRGDGVVRLFASTSGDVYVFSTELPALPASLRLLPVEAPWHPGGAGWDLAGVKSLSYAPNMAATRTAQAEGFDEALLISIHGHVLEGPTAGVWWAKDGVIYTPELSLGILRSVTAQHVMNAAESMGIEVRWGRYPLEDVLLAEEISLVSTTREVMPVTAVGDTVFDVGPITNRLSEWYREAVEALA